MMIKKISEFGNYYCDLDGNIYNAKMLKMKQSTSRSGYKTITLSSCGKKKSYLVHRLIASAFLIRHGFSEVNHINHIKSDNRALNLEWCDRSHNQLEMYKAGRLCKKGENQGTSKLSVADVMLIIREIQDGVSQVALAKRYKVSKQAINNIKTGRSWCHLPRPFKTLIQH